MEEKFIYLLEQNESFAKAYQEMAKTILWDYRNFIKGFDTIFLFGSGKDGKMAAEYLWDILKDKEVCFIDNNPLNQGKSIFFKSGNLMCYGKEKMYGCNPNTSLVLITTSLNAELISDELVGSKRYIVPTAYQTKDKLKYTYVDKDFIKWLLMYDEGTKYFGKKSELIQAYRYLEDDASREIMYRVVSGNIGGNICLREVTTVPQYFISEIVERFTKDEVFLDCGAFIGDSIEEFVQFTENNYKAIYSFEMDKDNFKRLEENPITMNKRITLINAGVSDREEKVTYRKGDTRSTYVNTCSTDLSISENEAELCSIDKLIEEGTIKDKVTFVKMDIEGAELDALYGMKEMIQRDKPKLAICVYHKLEDIYKIPLFIKELVPEYHLILRHHDPCGYACETVVYAYTD